MSSAKEELFENWPMMVVAFVLVFFAFGVPTFSLAFMYGPAMHEFGWTNAEVNLLSTSKFLIGGAAALCMGLVIDKVGGRWTVLVGTAVGGLAMALFLFATNLPVYYLAGALLGFSASSIVAAMQVVVARLFSANQGIAMGVVLTATSFGGVVMPQVWPPLLQVMNWRHIFLLLSIGPLVIAVPLWLIFMAHNRRMREIVSAPTLVRRDRSIWQHFRFISREPGFWLIALGVFLVSGVDQALTQNYVNFLRFDKGMDLNTTIKWAGTLFAVIGVLAKVFSGWFYDRFSIRGIAYFYLLLAASVWLGLPVVGVSSMLVFIIMRGLAHGGMIVDAPILTRHYFGMERIGMTIGIMSVAVNLGFAAGPPIFGWLADIYGNFSVGMIFFGAAAAVATLSLWWIKPRYWTPPADQAALAARAGVVAGQ
ncbi:MAG TPA: MFS transporter [Gammaproteobacteria bacterium]|nr:MFS transporter [Gammaproteobacteria bacterium]